MVDGVASWILGFVTGCALGIFCNVRVLCLHGLDFRNNLLE